MEPVPTRPVLKKNGEIYSFDFASSKASEN